MTTPTAEWTPMEIKRPARILFWYYVVIALPSLILFPIVFAPLLFKYETLRYRFDEKGVSMAWGILFRRETYLTYRRIQDIHLTRNLLQRWMGIATVEIHTASGSGSPEMSVVGLREAAQLRDYLYTRMRGARQEAAEATAGEGDEALSLLREIRDALRNGADA